MANNQQYEEYEERLAGALSSQATDEMRVTRTGEGDSNITSWGGTTQSGVDVSKKIDEIEDALRSVGTDEWRNVLYAEDAAATGSLADIHRRGDALQVSVESETTDLLRTTDQPLDVSAATVTVDDGGAFTLDAANQATLPVEQQTDVAVTASAAGGLAVEQQTPVGVENSTGTQIDPLASGDQPLGVENTDDNGNQTTSTGTDVAVSNPDGAVGIVADTTGSATLSVEVSVDGGTNWTEYTVSIADGSGHYEEVHGFTDVRASVNQNLSRLAIMAKGVGG